MFMEGPGMPSDKEGAARASQGGRHDGDYVLISCSELLMLHPSLSRQYSIEPHIKEIHPRTSIISLVSHPNLDQ